MTTHASVWQRHAVTCVADTLRMLLHSCRYAVLGVSVFGANDPVLMGTLHIAFLTLFRCATLEDWTDVMYIAMQGTNGHPGLLALPYGTTLHSCSPPRGL